MDEFSLIDKYLRLPSQRSDVALGIGDDAALLQLPSDRELVMCMDTLVDGVHFPSSTSAADIAYKSVAVNLSDLAAMGAEAAWLTLALTLPEPDEPWLSDFAAGLRAVCDEFGIELVGGDTTRGPLTVTVHATGFVEKGTAMRRDAARKDDLLYVSGELGAAACALTMMRSGIPDAGCLRRLNRPQPRLSFARELRAVCRCAIDISDGLLADLGHILDASGVGVTLDVSAVPISQAVSDSYDVGQALRLAMTGGDDYELLFTVAADDEPALERIATRHGLALTRLGVITQQPGIELKGSAASLDALKDTAHGYKHFG